MKHHIVTAAILKNNNQYLCMQRGVSRFEYMSYKYEFPGGKLEAGESFEEGLSRELHEELHIEVKVKPEHFFMTVDYEYPDFTITMHSYLIEVDSREFTLTEHVDYRWLSREQLIALDWAPADLPIVRKLME